jgi:hypothetical protein
MQRDSTRKRTLNELHKKGSGSLERSMRPAFSLRRSMETAENPAVSLSSAPADNLKRIIHVHLE